MIIDYKSYPKLYTVKLNDPDVLKVNRLNQCSQPDRRFLVFNIFNVTDAL